MRVSLKTVTIAVILLLSLAGLASAQAGRNRQKAAEQKKTERQEAARPEDAPATKDEGEPETGADDRQEVDTVKIDTNLVVVPVIASDRDNRYIADLQKEDFMIFDEGVEQEISFFETVTAPFHVVLMLDTSASTQEKLGQIQRAAIAFTEQLQKDDRVKVISFDDRVRDLSAFTSDRAVLQWAIRGTRPGQGTKLYDAMQFSINALNRVRGRKAIVIFTDGVDSYSDRETYDRNRRAIEEAGIIVYPIRYDTRYDVERMVRQQQQSGRIVDLATILGGGIPSTTPPTFPGGIPPPGGGGTTTGRTSLPGGVVISGGSTNNRRNYPNPNDPNDPRNNDPTRYPGPGGGTIDDSISRELDMMYRTGDAYLNEMAEKSGGKLHRADTLGALPTAFAAIAAELRTQYALGYYPPKETARDGKYHKIKVSTKRKSVVVRARPGYRAPSDGK
jgi:hypothetical protein